MTNNATNPSPTHKCSEPLPAMTNFSPRIVSACAIAPDGCCENKTLLSKRLVFYTFSPNRGSPDTLLFVFPII